MKKNNSSVDTAEFRKFLQTTNPHDPQLSGHIPVPVTCPYCDNYRENTKIMDDTQRSGQGMLNYRCSKCKKQFK